MENKIKQLMKPTRGCILNDGDPGAIPVTKIGGVPWWPAGTDRPQCSFGHYMSFVCQVRLRDVPSLSTGDPGLLSFHYCQKCPEEGHGSNGWVNSDDPIEATGYDVRIFEDCSKKISDGRGLLAVDFMKPRNMVFVDFLEVPELGEFRYTPALQPLYAPVREKYYGLDENDLSKTQRNFPGYLHVTTAKLGGWPTWFQYPEWPQDDPEERVTLIAQLEHLPDVHFEYWCNGMVYLFLSEQPGKSRAGKMTMQYT